MNKNRDRANFLYRLCLVCTFIVTLGFAQDSWSAWYRDKDGFYTRMNSPKNSKESDYRIPGPSIFFDCAFGNPRIERVEGGYYLVEIRGLKQWDSNPGEPILPVKSIKLLLPYGCQVVKVRVVPGLMLKMEGEKYLVKPAGAPKIASEIIAKKHLNQKVYGTDLEYPQTPCLDPQIQSTRGYNILVLNLFPVLYQGLSGKLAYYNNFSVYVETQRLPKDSGENSVKPDTDQKALKEITSLVDNPEALDNYQAVQGGR